MRWENIYIYEWLGDQSHQDEGSRITDGHKHTKCASFLFHICRRRPSIYSPLTDRPIILDHALSCSCTYACMDVVCSCICSCSCSCSAARSSVFDRSPLCSSTRTPTTMDHTYTYLSIGYLSLHSSTTINMISHACLAVLFSLPLELATTTTHFLFVSVSYPLSPVFFF